MSLPPDAEVPFHTIHLDYAELEKKREGLKTTQSFLVVLDQFTRYIWAKPISSDFNY